ncbi:hypothetical protein CSPAE12_06439 [Colletotrichum incanum]|nr:hypothetical protein CSPAE12_06439 [Colletotrichum incanum]
MGGGEHVAKAF